MAGELRAVVGSIEMIADLERMGGLAAHVAQIARRRHPQPVLPKEVHGRFAKMGRKAVELANQTRRALVFADSAKAARLREEDDTMDELYRYLFTVLMERNSTYGVPAAVDAALSSRFYERFADHVVEIGRRVIFEARGSFPAEEQVST